MFRERYHIADNRIVLHSHALSGPFAFHLATRERALYDGVVVSSSPLQTPPPDNDPAYRQQYLFVCGEKDEALKRVKQSVSGLSKMKYPASLREIPGGEADYPPAAEIETIARWIDALDRI
jgi:hypothetical protein